MAKRRGLQTFRKAVKSTVRAASAKNPPFWSEAFFAVAPAVATYAVTRLAGRAARIYLGPRYPKMRPYIPLAGQLAAAGVMYFACTKVSDLKKYRTAVLVGSGIAVTQTLLLTVAPQLAWLFDLPGSTRALGAPRPALTAASAADARLDALEAVQAPVGAVEDAEEELGDAPAEEMEELGGEELGEGWASPLTN